ncbi:MAG: hypothetical protein K9L31_02725 [Candidatus Pacebacteria bacterium]|nr:hypothetical protein [Candidatus Paceibacterota bacterium]
MDKNIAKLQKKVDSYLKENDLLLKKKKIKPVLVINFPKRKKIPFLSKIALKIVNKQGGIIDMQFIDNVK